MCTISHYEHVQTVIQLALQMACLISALAGCVQKSLSVCACYTICSFVGYRSPILLLVVVLTQSLFVRSRLLYASTNWLPIWWLDWHLGIRCCCLLLLACEDRSAFFVNFYFVNYPTNTHLKTGRLVRYLRLHFT